MSRDPSYGSPNGPKSVGAYYTPAPVARALCRWALRRPAERALDPAAGDGVFLAEAVRRVRELGGAASDVVGVEMRPEAVAEARLRLAAFDGALPQLTAADFLSLSPDGAPFDAVVGNPPFVRYQRLERAARERAAARAAAAGVRLDAMASSWAAFVVHAVAFLRPGGRLALVLPSEIGHARYARSVLAHLRSSFANVTFVLFESALFPNLDQGTVLLLAEGRGHRHEGFAVARLSAAEALADGLDAVPRVPVDAAAMIDGTFRLHHGWLPTEAAALMARLERQDRVSRLQAWATVSIGYVTGANFFFHLTPERARRLGIGTPHLLPALFRSGALTGVEVTERDWASMAERGLCGYLLSPADPGDRAVATYLTEGETRGVPSRTKVRHRRPWYRVTRTAPPDLVLTAMSAHAPRLAVNVAGLAVCNTLHGVRLHEFATEASGAGRVLALAALSSLTEVSAELEGHALGGGLLKLEPSEAGRILVPLPAPGGPSATTLAPELALAARRADRALRAGDRAQARAIADAALLEPLAGVGPEAAGLLRDAAARLRSLRRCARRRPPNGVAASPRAPS